MNDFKFDITQQYNFADICGTTTQYKTVFFDNEKIYPLVKGDLIEAFVDHMNIDKMCQYYGLNKYYLAGDYETNRILECCIMPIKYKFNDKLNFTNEGYLLFYNFCTDFKHHPILITNDWLTAFPKTLYDNPNDAGKEYITKRLDDMYDVYCHNEHFINLYENHFDDMIEEKRKILEVQYKQRLEEDVNNYKKELENEYDSKFADTQEILNYYNNNIKYAKLLNIDLNKYGEIIHNIGSRSEG